jgi:hypothetical protein
MDKRELLQVVKERNQETPGMNARKIYWLRMQMNREREELTRRADLRQD